MSNLHIIPFSPSEAQSWQQEISQSFKSLDELMCFLDINEADKKRFYPFKKFPLRITRFYANLIQKNNINDPLLLQIIPQEIENKIHPDYRSDAVGDLSALQLPGLIHKYQGRVLLSLTQACAIHCRYCFRREFPYSDNIPDLSPNGSVMHYLNSHPDIHELILSGGDPLMLSDSKLHALLQRVDPIKHIKTIRIHTRLPSILPTRITHKLLHILKSSNKQIVMVLHINHAQEINSHVQQACFALKQHGVTLLNQSVLLKNINDSAKTLTNLSFALFKAGILPYYIHSLDKVNGTAHFDVPRNEAIAHMKALKKQLPGYLTPKLVEEIEGKASKTHIL